MIVLTHVGNPIPNYVLFSLIHLRRYNSDADVNFILDIALQNENILKIFKKYKINIIDSSEYKEHQLIRDLNRLTWIKNLHPLGPPSSYGSQPNFWHLTMERIFYINAYINNNKINNVIHMENDNVLFYNYKDALQFCDENSINCLYRKHYGEESTLFSFTGIKNHNILNHICHKMLELIAMGEKSLQLKYGLDHISEMHLLNIIKAETDYIKYFPMLPNDNSIIFDPYGYGAYLLGDNLNHGPGHIDITDDIGKLLNTNNYELFLRNNIPVLKSKSGNDEYTIFNLHVHKKNIEKLL